MLSRVCFLYYFYFIYLDIFETGVAVRHNHLEKVCGAGEIGTCHPVFNLNQLAAFKCKLMNEGNKLNGVNLLETKIAKIEQYNMY